MARLVGFIGNRPDIGAKALELEGSALDVRRGPDVSAGWGVGFYQGGEILLKRRPIDDAPVVRPAELTRDVRGDILIAHVRAATVGALRTENTHPFRYRQWLFAQTGTVEAFGPLRGRLSDSLPQFLQRNVRGETDSELLFHLFLSFLHDQNLLDRPAVSPDEAISALRSTISLVDRLSAEEGAPPSRMNILLSSPEYLIALHGGAPMAYRFIAGKDDLGRMFGDAGLGRMRLPDLASCRLTLVASDFNDDIIPSNWTPIADRAVVTFSRTHEPSIQV